VSGGDIADVDQLQAPALRAGPGPARAGQGRDVRPGAQGRRRSAGVFARRADQGRSDAGSSGAGMNRRDALAGVAASLAFACLSARGTGAAAQSGSGDRMGTWAYSTEGFDRIVHRIEGIETVTYAIGPQGAGVAPLVYF